MMNILPEMARGLNLNNVLIKRLLKEVLTRDGHGQRHKR